MEKKEKRFFYPLTSLQIGDMQSYLSILTIFMPPVSKKFLILVDCRPWLTDLGMKPTHLWQLMVTKSRLSPFANRKVKRQKKYFSKRVESKKGLKLDFNNRKGWVSLVGAIFKHKKEFLPIEKLKDSFVRSSDLQDTFYGFIIFEVSWCDVRGINYVNELLMDTSMAVETKIMKRWEFDSMQKASNSLSSWFMGTDYERSLLLNFLNDGPKSGDVFFYAHENVCIKNDSIPSQIEVTTPISGVCKRRKITDSTFIIDEVDEHKTTMLPQHSSESSSEIRSNNENAFTAPELTHYIDVMILFRFDDHDLPFILRNVIIQDRRLLTLLEYGLPSWVIFLQSYPVFCKVYRPWMCPLARVLYILVSVATVLIGFFDLYKNVPVLKVTASRLCGPFFDWIESWEMISRIKCLGTMLFLHNLEIAVEWFVMTSKTAKSVVMVLTKPLVGPIIEFMDFLDPLRMICLEVAGGLTAITWNVIESTCNVVMSMVNLVLWPFWVVLSVTWGFATSIIYPIISIIRELLIFPARLLNSCINTMATYFSFICETIGALWSTISPLFQILPRAKVSSIRDSEIPIWRSLFLKVFHAIKGIVYGFIAFFAAINRHRLSISNHFQEMVQGQSRACWRLFGSWGSLKGLRPGLWCRRRPREEPNEGTIHVADQRKLSVEGPIKVSKCKQRKKSRRKVQTTSELVHT